MEITLPYRYTEGMVALIQVHHNSQKVEYRNPFGAVPTGGRVILSLAHEKGEGDEAFLCLQSDGKKMRELPMLWHEKERVWQIEIKAPSTPTLLWYFFRVRAGDTTYFYGACGEQRGGVGTLYAEHPRAYQITVYKKGFTTPNWFKEGIVYQIFVDRFYNGSKDGAVLNPKKNSFLYGSWQDPPMYIKGEAGNILRWEFFGGNLQGIMEKLPYLQGLGVTILYLNPIFEAASNHKYDTGDYLKIDPMFGTEEDFHKLCKEAAALGMKVILDGVFSHTGSDSIYFNREGNYDSLGAHQSTESPYYSWYSFQEHPHRYDSWWGIGTMPNVQEMEPTFLDFILTGEDSVVRHWMKAGARGWRLDVADELPDPFIKTMRRVMKDEDEESILIGEVWEEASHKISYNKRREFIWGEALDSVMNYPFRSLVLQYILGHLSGADLHRGLMALREHYPAEAFYSAMNLIGSHDVTRVLTLLGEAPPHEELTESRRQTYRLPQEQRDLALARLKLLILFQMTFPGTPHLYYGDEAGVQGFKDPHNRSTFPWGQENEDLLSWCTTMIALRHDHAMLKTGTWQPLCLGEDVYGFQRSLEEGKDVFGQRRQQGRACIFLNRSTHASHTVTLKATPEEEACFRDFVQGKAIHFDAQGQYTLELPPLSGQVLGWQE